MQIAQSLSDEIPRGDEKENAVSKCATALEARTLRLQLLMKRVKMKVKRTGQLTAEIAHGIETI